MVLTKAEAARAMYVDFEGNTDTSPTLLGVLYRRDGHGDDEVSTDVVEQWVVEPAFFGAVDDQPGSPTGASDLTELAVNIVRKAKRDSRRIVSWSMHDVQKFEQSLGARRRMPQALKHRHRNAIRTAETWAKAMGLADGFERNTQATYMRLVGYTVPDTAGAGTTGDSLREIRAMLETRENDWAQLTPNKRERFARVLEHNWHDLHGMRAVVMRAAGELDVREPKR